MNTLRIPVTSIGNAGYVFEERVRVSSIQPPDTKALPVENALVSGRFERLGEEFLFRAACMKALVCVALSPLNRLLTLR